MSSRPLRSTLPLILALVTGLVLVARPARSAPNLLINPGFEDGVAGHPWMAAGWDTSRSNLSSVFFGRDTFDVHGGRYAVTVASASNLFTMAHNWSQMLMVGPDHWGKDLVFSVWTRNVGVEGRAYIKVDAYQDTISKMARTWGVSRDEAGTRLGINPIDDPLLDLAWQRLVFPEPESEWTQRMVRVYLPPSTNVVFVRVGIIGIGQVMLDDASLTLEPAQPPAEVPLHQNLLADGGFEGTGDAWEYSIPPYPGIKADRDTIVKHSGRSALRFTSPRAAMVPGPAGVAQAFCNRGLAGKRLRFSAYIKPDSLRSSAYIKVICKTLHGVEQEVSRMQIAGTMDWTRAELEMDAPRDTYAVWAWITYTAPARGQVFFDDADFQVIGAASDTRGARDRP